MNCFWTDCKLQLKKKKKRGLLEAISPFFFFLIWTIAKNNSKREGSEEMAEVAELPQAPKFHTVKTRRGNLSEMCLMRPLK